jgi:RNA:NAD 2'-phosphotransferase (TPT1/KptA family)
VLRHGAHKAGLGNCLTPDGFVPLRRVLALPRFDGVTFERVQALVAADAKGRFELKGGSEATTDGGEGIPSWLSTLGSCSRPPRKSGRGLISLSSNNHLLFVSVHICTEFVCGAGACTSTHVYQLLLPRFIRNRPQSRLYTGLEPTPRIGDASTSHVLDTTMIRACQGHTLTRGLDDEAMLTQVTFVSEGEDGGGAGGVGAGVAAVIEEAVHGTTMAAWGSIREHGLSRMRRRHVHLALGLPGVGSSHITSSLYQLFCPHYSYIFASASPCLHDTLRSPTK